MAKDDYFVVVYQLLKYLYEHLKAGTKPDAGQLSAEYLNIPVNYWVYILKSLSDHGYITELHIIRTKDGVVFSNLSDSMITPGGIQFLFENSLIEKTKRTLKDIKDITPFF